MINILMRFFIIDWIVDYINTPKYEMTIGCEILFYAALAIIFGVVLGIIFIGAMIKEKMKK